MNVTCFILFTWLNHIEEHYKFQLLVSKRIRNKIIMFSSQQRRHIKKRDFVCMCTTVHFCILLLEYKSVQSYTCSFIAVGLVIFRDAWGSFSVNMPIATNHLKNIIENKHDNIHVRVAIWKLKASALIYYNLGMKDMQSPNATE